MGVSYVDVKVLAHLPANARIRLLADVAAAATSLITTGRLSPNIIGTVQPNSTMTDFALDGFAGREAEPLSRIDRVLPTEVAGVAIERV